MRKINYGINSYHKTASIIVEHANPLIFVLDRISEFICGNLILPAPLPNFKIIRDGEKTTIKEYYGDLRSLYHLWIHYPIFQYCAKKMDAEMIDIDYDKARKVFYDNDKKFWDESEERAKEMREDEDIDM